MSIVAEATLSAAGDLTVWDLDILTEAEALGKPLSTFRSYGSVADVLQLLTRLLKGYRSCDMLF